MSPSRTRECLFHDAPTPLSWVVVDVSRVAPAQADKKALALRRALVLRRGRECGRGIVSPCPDATLAEGLPPCPKLTLLEAK